MSRGTAFPQRLHVLPAKTAISLRTRAVWSESDQNRRYPPDALDLLLPTEGPVKTDQTARVRRLIWVFTGAHVFLLQKLDTGVYISYLDCVSPLTISTYSIYNAGWLNRLQDSGLYQCESWSQRKSILSNWPMSWVDFTMKPYVCPGCTLMKLQDIGCVKNSSLLTITFRLCFLRMPNSALSINVI